MPIKMKASLFTLIELLVVVAIIGILASILMPSLHRAKEEGKRAVCKSNMKQMGYAATLYADDNDGIMPNYQNKVTTNPLDSGTRNVQYHANKVGIGRTIEQKYIDVAAAPGVIHCPSRSPSARNSYPGTASWTWARWDLGTTEYSYQHRLAVRLAEADGAEDAYGGDLGIWDTHIDNGVNYGNMSVGDNVCHGGDFYNVNFFDMSVRGIRDLTKKLETTYVWNNPRRVLQTFEEIAAGEL